MSKIKTKIGSYIEDITGQTFHRLTVLELTDEKDFDNRWLWKCQCECGNIVYVSMHRLKQNNTKSCGCLQKDKVIEKNKANAYDVSNQRKGHLVALEPVPGKQQPSGGGGRYWKIQCDCGNIFEMTIGEWNRDNYGDGHRARYACPLCTSRSKGEQLPSTILDACNIQYIREWTDEGRCINPVTQKPLRFDFYLPNQNLCIEYDGIQHFTTNGGYFDEDFIRQVQNRDRVKNEYCAEHRIQLLRIPYTDYNILDKTYLENKGVSLNESV